MVAKMKNPKLMVALPGPVYGTVVVTAFSRVRFCKTIFSEAETTVPHLGVRDNVCTDRLIRKPVTAACYSPPLVPRSRLCTLVQWRSTG